MGQNLVLNMNDHGYKVAVFNRTVSKVDDFINNEAKGTEVVGAHSIQELVDALKRPRRVMLMVKAGDTVVILEAMKMEQPLTAHKDGTVTGLAVEVGQTVSADTEICQIKE